MGTKTKEVNKRILMTEFFFDSPSIAFYSGRVMEQNQVWIMHPCHMLYIQKVSLPGPFNTWCIYTYTTAGDYASPLKQLLVLIRCIC